MDIEGNVFSGLLKFGGHFKDSIANRGSVGITVLEHPAADGIFTVEAVAHCFANWNHPGLTRRHQVGNPDLGTRTLIADDDLKHILRISGTGIDADRSFPQLCFNLAGGDKPALPIDRRENLLKGHPMTFEEVGIESDLELVKLFAGKIDAFDSGYPLKLIAQILGQQNQCPLAQLGIRTLNQHHLNHRHP